MSARALCFQIGTALLLSLGGLWAATQWAAAMLAYQPALGAPLAEAFGCALYAPWKLFGWWLAFDPGTPPAQARARFREKYGREPAEVLRAGALLLVGPIVGQEREH